MSNTIATGNGIVPPFQTSMTNSWVKAQRIILQMDKTFQTAVKTEISYPYTPLYKKIYIRFYIILCPSFADPDEKIRLRSTKSIKYIHRDLIDENSDKLWKQIKEFLVK